MIEPFNYDHPAFEDQRRKDARKAHLEASAANMTAASMEAHRADHAQVTAGQGGIFGTASAYDMAAEVHQRTARVGDGAGAGRELERLGGTYPWSAVSDSPAPAMVDLRYVNTPGRRPTCMGSLKAHMHGQQ